MNRHIRNVLLNLLIITFTLLTLTPVVYANNNEESKIKDYEKYWLSAFVYEKENSDEQGVLRSELAVLLSRLFGLTDTSGKVRFTDVKEDEWYAKDIDKITASGVMNYAGANFEPDRFLTREEAAYAIANAYQMSIETEKVFVDEEEVDKWARAAAHTLVELGYIETDETGAFRPKDKITRKELKHIIEQASCKVIDQPGDYTENVNGNLIVNRGSVVIKNATIFGNVYLSSGIGQGDIRLENTTIKGNIILQKGMSMHGQNTSLNKVIVVKSDAFSKLTKKDIEKAKSVIVKVVTTEIDDEITGIGIITKSPVTSCMACYEGKTIKGEETIITDSDLTGESDKLYEIYFHLPKMISKQSYNIFPIQVSMIIEGETYQFGLKTDLKN